MASCDDDFNLLGDDQSNPNQHHHHQVLHHAPYAPRRFTPKLSNQIHVPHHQSNGDDEEHHDVVASSAFHGVNPFSTVDENSNHYDNNAAVDGDQDLDGNGSRIGGGVRLEKRQSREELSDGGTTNGGETTPSLRTRLVSVSYHRLRGLVSEDSSRFRLAFTNGTLREMLTAMPVEVVKFCWKCNLVNHCVQLLSKILWK